MPKHTRFEKDLNIYGPSDSDEDYTENEKLLIDKIRESKTNNSESEEEVYAVGSDDEGNSDLALSDVEGLDDHNVLPDVRAWGKNKKQYYSADYVDADYGGYQGKDAHLAKLEEEEAQNLQKRLAEQLDDDDFSLEVFTKNTDEGKKEVEEVIKADISKLTKRQKLQILEKESPEFFGLIDDCKEKLVIANDYLYPLIQIYKHGKIRSSAAVDFTQIYYETVLNYLTNINIYLLLQASKVNVQNHPVIKRLYQYRQLFYRLEPKFEKVIKPQIEYLLNQNICDEKNAASNKNQRKTLKLLSKLKAGSQEADKKLSKSSEHESPPKSKKVKFDDGKSKGAEIINNLSPVDEKSNNEVPDECERQENDEIDVNNKRAITYQIAKNKGLTPHRKKEQRNPRVKNRMKFRKAVIRRKGAVRQPRHELKRYSGEVSGIKSSVTKSIKFKS